MDAGRAALIGLIVGTVIGLIPFGSGFYKDRVALGAIGLVASAISGAILGLLLAIPVALVFTLAIFLMRGEGRQTRQA